MNLSTCPAEPTVRASRQPRYPPRVLTATSLFDGHDAAINIIRRLLVAEGAEVIHLGHNRAVTEIVSAAIQEDADAIAVSAYQGGHMEFYPCLLDQLALRGASDIPVFGGGGGVILAREIRALKQRGVRRIYTPEDGRKAGFSGIIADLLDQCDIEKPRLPDPSKDDYRLARRLTEIERGRLRGREKQELFLRAQQRRCRVPVVGITGTGGSGKSSVCDELIRRLRRDYGHDLKIAVLAVDPSRSKSGGALLGDRIRMNHVEAPAVFMRSLATRGSMTELPTCLPALTAALIDHGSDLVVIETPGIGQGASAIAAAVNFCVYVMTAQFGSGLQLEKIDMFDYAHLIAINKSDRPGSSNAVRSVEQHFRATASVSRPEQTQPRIYPTCASYHNDSGMEALYAALLQRLLDRGFSRPAAGRTERKPDPLQPPQRIPAHRSGYLHEIAQTVRDYRENARQQSRIARELEHYQSTGDALGNNRSIALDALIQSRRLQLSRQSRRLLSDWCDRNDRADPAESGDPSEHPPATRTLSGIELPRTAVPRFQDRGALLSWLMLENLPGHFPYTAGVFARKRRDEMCTRMFAGEGTPAQTNARLHYLTRDSSAKRLSIAFDPVTLYGADPDRRADIFGQIGNSGVSIATLDDMRLLFEGFDLCDPHTSVSMTINGPAAIILAMFFNTAIDQQMQHFRTRHDREADAGEQMLLRERTLQTLRGTVQADILKEDQGQNTCILSTDFSLRLMADVQAWFIEQRIRRFYSVSISGYHIAEAGANPVTQLAFTLANAFTYVEAYRARGMRIEDFAANFSFFFSSGMDPEYAVIGRVARRIWAIALRDRYGVASAACGLKYHMQTSGRSLHARTLDFNDIRTTLEALGASYSHCNSLHTNARDEAASTPTQATVRKALAIQLIIDREWGLSGCDNPDQGAFLLQYLTDQVEEAVLNEFEQLSRNGGVLAAMETGYQRSRIQDESIRYENAKSSGEVPLVGVNTFADEESADATDTTVTRCGREQKLHQIAALEKFHHLHAAESSATLRRVRIAAQNDENMFAVLMDAVRVCSLGQIMQALYDAGGRYRRNL